MLVSGRVYWLIIVYSPYNCLHRISSRTFSPGPTGVSSHHLSKVMKARNFCSIKGVSTGMIQEISNRTHWTDPWVSNSTSNLPRGPLVRSHSIFDGYEGVQVRGTYQRHPRRPTWYRGGSDRKWPGRPCLASGTKEGTNQQTQLNQTWLVVSTHLKNMSQNGNLPQIGVKIQSIWNHHPAKHNKQTNKQTNKKTNWKDLGSFSSTTNSEQFKSNQCRLSQPFCQWLEPGT